MWNPVSCVWCEPSIRVTLKLCSHQMQNVAFLTGLDCLFVWSVFTCPDVSNKFLAQFFNPCGRCKYHAFSVSAPPSSLHPAQVYIRLVHGVTYFYVLKCICFTVTRIWHDHDLLTPVILSVFSYRTMMVKINNYLLECDISS